MTLLSEEQKKKLQDLFYKEKFPELELEIELISDFKSRSPFLANLLGVAKLKKISKSENDWTEARNLFLDAYQKAPDYDDALCNYAHVSVKLRDYEHAFNELLKRRNKGYSSKINEALARIYFFEGDIDHEISLFKENLKNNHLTPQTASHLLVSMNYSSNFNQSEYLKCCKIIDAKFKIDDDELQKLNKYELNDELRVGILSPDFKEHSVSYFLKSIFEGCKKKNIKLIALNLRREDELDLISKKLKKNFHEWIDLSKLNDFDSANLIIKNILQFLQHQSS